MRLLQSLLILTALAACGESGAQPPAGAPPATGASVETNPPNRAGQQPAFPGQTRAPEQKLGVAFDVQTYASGLQTPWGMTFLPDGRLLVTEKAGTLRIVAKDGSVSAPITGTPTVYSEGQGGLLDVALSPQFATDGLVYLSFAEPGPNGTNGTAVARGKLVESGGAGRLDGLTVIYSQTPKMASRLHFGSRLVFAPDGNLFVTQGDRSILPGRAQAGLGAVLLAEVHAVAGRLGYQRAIHALMHETNPSRNLSAHYAGAIRRYTLFKRSLASG